jgi:DNA-binding IclR family transcriptional regulator
VAAGVADTAGSLTAAVHIHGPAYRFPGGREAEMGDLVLEAATTASERLRRSA